ncbi:hypothetical protein [Roseibacillus ishigakijimensis]|uniref:hypothetical protein n=1 Tax=Roseibacillus ishigakijimensis TaxID=454146 RepID=UPI001908E794|nr:hypothetical protein [Roseibacillus ishigakijimensis]
MILDDFSFGESSLSSEGMASDSVLYDTLLTERREILGAGEPSWVAAITSQELSFSVSQHSPSPRRTYLSVSYFSSEEFSLFGYNAFAVDLVDVVGSGELVVSVDGSFGRDVAVPINGDGMIISPFEYLGTTEPLDSLTSIRFRFYAVSEDFSAKIDNLRLVPELSSALLLGIGGLLVVSNRCRD